ncbi:hypothetical protein AB0B28_21510 [Glycomyces sp. NPDC046736]|uniref:hypothetical protein n=1 Tax=Glycomyces sp. NPDC046736 TaxID=3155615 RepID=UPI0033E49C59
MCTSENRTRVVLDESEIQRRLNRPRRPSLAERYAGATDPAERERLYGENFPRRETRPPSKPAARAPSTVWITRPILHARGWTDDAIRKHLPAPERTRPNPHHRRYKPMPLWRAETVARAESTKAWQTWLNESLSRRRNMSGPNPRKDPDFPRRAAKAANAITASRRP